MSTELIQVAAPQQPSAFVLACDAGEAERIANAHFAICEAIEYTTGAKLPTVNGEAGHPYTILTAYDAASEADTYTITCESTDGEAHIRILYNGKYALLCAIDRFLKSYVTENGTAVPAHLQITGICRESDAVITTDIPVLRDPFIIQTQDGTYYAYGTGWVYYRNTSGNLGGHWAGPVPCVDRPADTADNMWAPEVHFYRGAYYMFTTYFSAMRGRRGCTILKSDSPQGPFREITGGHITPDEWDAIDGTLYVDENGQPWLVFVHEWVSAPGQCGSFAAMRLKDDLSGTVGTATELFTATAPQWARAQVTDGCFMYRTQNGRLLMLWSNWDSHGYCVGIANATKPQLPCGFVQNERRLFSKTVYGTYDGGHGMVFTNRDGQMYLSVHSPNNPGTGRRETPILMPIREAYGTLLPDIWKK